MLMNARQSLLLVVDVQERLVPAMHEAQRVVDHAAWLVQVAGELDVPVLASQQYPRGLGPLVPELAALCSDAQRVDKLHFSCADAPECRERIDDTGCGQIVLAGIEAHVCVLQTAVGLAQSGYSVFVVREAVSSRRAEDAELALARMRAAGVEIVNREMVAFEWLHRAGTDAFRNISKHYVR